MALFDFRPYRFKVEIEKPKDNVYKYGDKIKGKIELFVEKEFYAKELKVTITQEIKTEIYSTIDKTYETKISKDKVFEKKFLDSYEFRFDKDNLPKRFHYDFEYVLEEPKDKDKNIVNKVFDVIYPDRKTYKYFFKAILDFRMKKPEIYEKELIVKDSKL